MLHWKLTHRSYAYIIMAMKRLSTQSLLLGVFSGIPTFLLIGSTALEAASTCSLGIIGALYSQFPPSTTNVSPLTQLAAFDCCTELTGMNINFTKGNCTYVHFTWPQINYFQSKCIEAYHKEHGCHCNIPCRS